MGWRFWIDRGGTFTDLVGRGPDGDLVARKVLCEQRGRPGDPAVAAIREVLGLPAADAAAEPIPAGLIEEVRIGTTVATNALLERRGAPTLLLISRGFADALVIGDQHRPELFALEIRRPPPLYSRVLEVDGRLAADGRELEPLRCDGALEAGVRQAIAAGCTSCAVVLLHAARHPRHEQELGRWLERFGFEQVALSHAVGAQPRLVPRGQTTVVEATVAPVLWRYLGQLRAALGDQVRLSVMQSSGGLIAPDLLRAKDTILSGPAGGMVAAVKLAAGAGVIIGFDMGGTSTDVFHFDAATPGGWERASETAIAGLTLQAPMLPIHTVAAGGGSVLHFDGQRLQVGPGSAGADPGPACYRRGGPLTITDANLLLGRLRPECFPAVFGTHRDQPLDPEAVRRAFTLLAERVAVSSGVRRTPEELAEGALEIAIDRMASAIHRISIQRGHDIRGATLVCFGGAGGQHACALADRMGIRTVLLHPLAGVLSAYGMGLAERRLLRERPVRERLTADLPQRLGRWAEGLIEAGREDLRRSDPSIGAVEVERTVALRVPASEVSLPVPLEEAQEMREAFGRLHHQRYGYVPAVGELVVERLVVELVAAAPEAADTTAALPPPPQDGAAPSEVPLFIGGSWRRVPLLRREAMVPGAEVSGPALIVEATGTNLLAMGWRARLLADGELRFTAGETGGEDVGEDVGEAGGADTLPPDPVRLELFNHRFAAIAEQMGVRLQQSARSVNIRERHDFSCAVFDGEGALVANAPHIPVHLGSMGESVAALLAAVRRGERPPLRPGDVVVSNDPSNGGTHLPDLTVITPVFTPEPEPEPGGGSGPAFFVASRGHHADVGGITPGSMPPFSRELAEEGLLLDNVPLLRGGRLLEEEWRRRLAAGPHPVRDPDQLLADLQAQVAANRLGEQLLTDLARREGAAVVRAYMAYVQDNAAEAVRRVIERLEDGRFELPLDGGQRIAVAVRIDRQRRRARIDFSGTSAQDPGNLNAPLAITRAVVLYVFRCLVGEPIPLNAGCFRPLDLVVPQGCLLHPGPTAAVVAGNVETSQAIANALFGALGVLAAGQGTMNNLSFGNAHCQYYETIAGGSGAGDGYAGAAAVQTHMTNSRLTDPEILEERFPVRVETFALRRGSGGAGRWSGGDGLVRRLRFLEPMTVALLSGSRRVAPFALAGGRPGLVGRNRLEHADGRVEELSGSAQLEVSPGDALLIETPGGGGYGAP